MTSDKQNMYSPPYPPSPVSITMLCYLVALFVTVLEGFRLCVQLPPEVPIKDEKKSTEFAAKKDKEKDKWKKRHKQNGDLDDEDEEIEVMRSNWLHYLPDLPQPRAGAGWVVVGRW